MKVQKNTCYLEIPIDFAEITKGDVVKRCSNLDSIVQHINLIITSHLGENLFVDEFGCSVWEYDFDNTVKDSRLKDKVRDSLCVAVTSLEKRLDNVSVDAFISQAELGSLEFSRRIKKKVVVHVNGLVKETGEEFSYNEAFYLGPLSYY